MSIEPFALPPEEAIQWFREKGYRLGYDWRDTWGTQHARAFTVAKAMQLDILADIREHVDRALVEGTTLEQFKKDLRPLLQAKGWWGEREEVDPVTGETKVVQLGSARRLRIIYETNLRQAHSAGRWQRIERLKKSRPYLRYITRSPGPNRRPEHQGWRDTVLPVDHPWWDTHMPMNGWGCECSVQQLSERDVRRLGLSVAESAPDDGERTWTNQRTGETARVPGGISPGFDYNPGKGRLGKAPSELPVLEPVRSFGDYGRAPAATVTGRPAQPKPLAIVDKGPGRIDRVRDRFREVFGTSAAAPSVEIADPKGQLVVFDERVLPQHLARKHGRERYLPHARATVEHPHEIWMVPFRTKDGAVTIRQRYIGLFQGDRPGSDVLVVVEDSGAFTTYTSRSIDSERVGYLYYP